MKILICVEGDSDIKFVKDFVNYYDFKFLSNQIDYIKSGGKDGLKSIRKNLIQPDEDGFNIIIQDLDSDDDIERREKINHESDGLNLKVFFIKSGNLNCLDELLESSVTNSLNEFETCWNGFNDCLGSIYFIKNKLELKDKLYVYKLMCLTSIENRRRVKFIGDKEVDYKSNRFFNLEHECFNELKSFFETIEN